MVHFSRTLISIFLVLGLQICYSQNTKIPIMISEDVNDSSLIVQKYPHLFYDANKGFIVTWQDYRNGSEETFAQKFNNNLTLKGTNFKTDPLTFVAYSSSSTSLGVNRVLELVDEHLSDYKRKYEAFTFDNSTSLQKTNIGNARYYSGALSPENCSLVKVETDFISAVSIIGTLQITRVSNKGKKYIVLREKDKYPPPIRLTLAANKSGEYVVGFTKESTDGIYIKSFANNDLQIVTKKIADKEYSNSSNAVTILPNSDSLFNVFTFEKEKIRSTKIDIRGNVISDTLYDVFASNPPQYYKSGDFYFSNLSNNKRAMIIHTYSKTALIYLDANNQIITPPIVYSTMNIDYKRGIFLDADNNLITVKAMKSDIYLVKSKDNEIINITKINDDVSGSNERYPSIIDGKNKGFYVMWKNEKNTFGRLLDSTGNVTTNSEVLSDKNFAYFADGTKLQLWEKYDGNNKQVGFSLYNNNSEMQKEVILETNGKVVFSILNEKEFIIAYINGEEKYLTKYSINGEMLKRVKLEEQEQSNSLENSIFIVDSNYFYFIVGYKISKYNFSLENILHDITPPVTPNLSYIGNSNFFVGYYDSGGQIGHAFIYVFSDDKTSNTNLVGNFNFYISDPKLKVKQINDSTFAVTTGRKLDLYDNRTFEIVARKDNLFKISDMDIESYDFKSNGDKVMFVWSAKKSGAGNYNIYAATYSMDYLVDVKGKLATPNELSFSLSQNYPNPFNPTTEISYQIPKTNYVNLTVYNMLGQVVEELINTTQKGGKYRVKFNAKDLSSGIYFYKLTSGSFTKTNKMLLIK